MEQLVLFELQAKRKPLDFSKFQTPLSRRNGTWYDEQYSIGRFAYWDSEREMIVLSPTTLWVSFWKDDKTPEGELKTSPNGLPKHEKEIWRQRRTEWDAEWQAEIANAPAVIPKKPRKSYKWSKEAKARNRRKRLRQRIEKAHGYDPNRPDLFDGEILIAIDAEYHERINDNPVYFIKGEYNKDSPMMQHLRKLQQEKERKV